MESLYKRISRVLSRKWKYQPLVNHEPEDIEKENGSMYNSCLISICLAAVLFIGIIISWGVSLTRAPTSCIQPVRRMEWRELNKTQKKDYISAVVCLAEKESHFEPGSSRYDDFAYMHVFEGTVTHYAASFLPWHRYFIHTYEKALTEECDFHGSLPYWDWALDAHDLAASPIFDPIDGFGGNGTSRSSLPTMFGGHCVPEGPFANATRHWQSKSNGHGFDILKNPHCLSRGFQGGEKKTKLENRVTIDAINSVLSLQSYEEFVDALEVQAHNSIPQFVRGDFYGLTAPNDPVFYLHHAQVDRLWWLWQQQDIESRTKTYQGPRQNTRVHANESLSGSSLDDVISLGNLSEPVRVHEITGSVIVDYDYVLTDRRLNPYV
ncbi:related to monophenol monooxygenase (tyrosinase) [Fusarium fujikuroi IMI 58289]|uniref:Related to monophenol monooxygenase (Tyrosinase) n=1 Tax=Gibberella fujikuroi (strain CBS 195.34 / IMI 58289 / NRRL A-6831) TaxID=1279085 RepID=S0DQZ0_GIBF5|nr:related to monophenol monooxygenase (tyrosinase) [Fusarium fujikuroi IMI 58289]KLP21347.1 monophenol monooxygenase (tyrosinase) [Fusarium fujikuroi]CCT64870.1 related to monophenol monooxygenase (tyrosinase) [Fusarium fujikuroi IMI 58289]SCN89821.1 related to monophenol monooxygenase (tyrosinase) [Fusarium fujikuroi]